MEFNTFPGLRRHGVYGFLKDIEVSGRYMVNVHTPTGEFAPA
jgi:hypothetical protein